MGHIIGRRNPGGSIGVDHLSLPSEGHANKLHIIRYDSRPHVGVGSSRSIGENLAALQPPDKLDIKCATIPHLGQGRAGQGLVLHDAHPVISLGKGDATGRRNDLS